MKLTDLGLIVGAFLLISRSEASSNVGASSFPDEAAVTAAPTYSLQSEMATVDSNQAKFFMAAPVVYSPQLLDANLTGKELALLSTPAQTAAQAEAQDVISYIKTHGGSPNWGVLRPETVTILHSLGY